MDLEHMDVRQVRPNDLEGFYSLFREVHAEGLYSARPQIPPKDAVKHALTQVIEHDWPLYVVEHRGRIVGSAEAYPERFCRADGNEAVGILGMQIHCAYRCQGLGTALLTHVIDHSRRIGFEAIELSVLASNLGARALYDRFGFTRVEMLQQCVLPGGAVDTPIKMRLVL